MVHIEERKAYTEGLKEKITKLKQQIASLESEGVKNQNVEYLNTVNTESIE